MKVVALVSGGKDSTYNMLHCIVQGHEIVAMANLHPPLTSESDEMDSFMYQTVGYTALEKYSECMGGVPMYRRAITGTSAIQSLEYKPVASMNDETEDLYLLLQTVLENHPDIKGVSVGAILSTYQRTRVENVCQRLGLTSLAYLWERSQSELLDEIIDGGVDARIIKTAAYGLGKRHLGQSLANIRSELIKMNSMFGLHLCGEGGEYETLVFDSPLFVKRLVAGSQKILGSSHDDVYHLTLSDFSTEQKDENDDPFGTANLANWKDRIAVPSLLEEHYQTILDRLDETSFPEQSEAAAPKSETEFTIAHSSTSGAVYNLTAPQEAKNQSIEEEAAQLFSILADFAKKHNISSTSQFTFASLILKSMADFQTVNSVYSAQFLEPIPPARVCVESNSIINGMRMQLALNFVPSDVQKTGLHIQGRSYWAPANIGPYSQATKAQGVVFLAGQIPLIPSSMELLADTNDTKILSKQAVLSLQHINRVRSALKSDAFAYVVAIVNSSVAKEYALKTWELYCTTDAGPSMFVVEVSGLPRGASVEWTGTGIDQVELDLYGDYDYDEDDSNTDSKYLKNPVFLSLHDSTICLFGNQVVATYSMSSDSGTTNTLKTRKDFEMLWKEAVKLDSESIQHVTGTLYVTPLATSVAHEWLEAFDNQLEVILVDSIFNSAGNSLSVALITRGVRTV